MSWYITCLKKYADFGDRAQRKEYWMFALVNFLIIVGIGIVGRIATGSATGGPIVVNIYQLAVLFPSLAVGVRRMHDTDHSGWWLLVPFVNLYFTILAGDAGDNRFGPDPQGMVIGTVESRARTAA